MYGAFISCAARIFLPTDSFESSTLGAQARRARSRAGELVRVVVVAVGDRQHRTCTGASHSGNAPA